MRTAAELALPTPALAGGRAETIVVAPSEGLDEYVASLAARAEAVRSRGVQPTEDNMLKISNDGRSAALDLRLVGLAPDPAGGKIAAAADRIGHIWETNQDRMYLGERGQPEARRGSLQLVFCQHAGRVHACDDEARDNIRCEQHVHGLVAPGAVEEHWERVHGDDISAPLGKSARLIHPRVRGNP